MYQNIKKICLNDFIEVTSLLRSKISIIFYCTSFLFILNIYFHVWNCNIVQFLIRQVPRQVSKLFLTVQLDSLQRYIFISDIFQHPQIYSKINNKIKLDKILIMKCHINLVDNHAHIVYKLFSPTGILYHPAIRIGVFLLIYNFNCKKSVYKIVKLQVQ